MLSTVADDVISLRVSNNLKTIINALLDILQLLSDDFAYGLAHFLKITNVQLSTFPSKEVVDHIEPYHSTDTSIPFVHNKRVHASKQGYGHISTYYISSVSW